LSPGTEVTTLQSDNEDYVDFSLPQKDLGVLRAGLPVKLTVKQTGIELDGVVAAVDPSVNQRTRSVELRASTKDPEKRLRPGMFVNVSIELDKQHEVIAIPVTAVVRAPYGDSIFLIEQDPKDKSRQIARQQFVRLGEMRGDFVAVEKGLEPDRTVVSAGAFKLRSGVPVKINNDIPVNPQQNPTPENR
jgi:membrane fusion protein, multidrug efflux system